MPYSQKPLKFYDVKAKRAFKTSKYKIIIKKVRGKKRKFAVTQSPYSDITSWRILKTRGKYTEKDLERIVKIQKQIFRRDSPYTRFQKT